MRFAIFGFFALAGVAHGHLAVFNKAMYCLNGTKPGVDNQNHNTDVVTPLWNLTKEDFWFQHVNGCDKFPPAPGDFLELPAGGSFTVEIATGRDHTTLSYNSKYTSDWPDGNYYPDDYSAKDIGREGHVSPKEQLHTQNQSMAAGTAFAISYNSNLADVTSENLAVFAITSHTPWKRLTTYHVPTAMPACPEDGCTCAWGWVPNGCGEPNMFMQGFKCKVTGATSTNPVARAKPPVWCEDDPSKCVKGAKQMIYWHQADGNNIEVSGYDLSGSPRSPGYNNKLGFPDGAQNDIFEPSSGSNVLNANPKSNTTDPAPKQTPSKPPSKPSSKSPSKSPLPKHPSSKCTSHNGAHHPRRRSRR